MNWFQNLNATPQLMTCFSVMIALTLGMAAAELNNLSDANQRVQNLYESQAMGKSSRRGSTSATRLPAPALATIGADNDPSFEEF
ncbi:MAG: hypothetical protein WB439_05675 [Acidobacteriaceae bacterium]